MSINSTIAVDLLGQCASRDGRRRLLLLERRSGRLRPRRDVLQGRPGLRRARTPPPRDDTISKIVAQLAPGDVVTTLKNTVDKVVTEWGVAELRGRQQPVLRCPSSQQTKQLCTASGDVADGHRNDGMTGQLERRASVPEPFDTAETARCHRHQSDVGERGKIVSKFVCRMPALQDLKIDRPAGHGVFVGDLAR